MNSKELEIKLNHFHSHKLFRLLLSIKKYGKNDNNKDY
jgi:hypothetical protein